MILTVTPNTALDRVLFLSALHRNRRNQAVEAVEAMGGKGCNVSMILRELGEETVATGLAAGDTGRRMEAILRAVEVTPDFVWTSGETRTNTVLIETEGEHHTTVCSAGLRPDDRAQEALLSWVDRWAQAARVVVLAGSLPESWPPEYSAQFVRAARRYAPVVVDASGAALQACLSEGVAAVKPNRDELESVSGPLGNRAEVLSAALRLRHYGPDRVLASMGADGALLVSPNGAWFAPAPDVPVVNPAGAGDGMTAGLALALARGWDDEETLRWAMAVSGAIVMTRGTAEVHRADVECLLPQVRLERLEMKAACLLCCLQV